MNRRSEAGQAGGGGAPVRKTLPAWPPLPYFPAVPPRWLQNINRKDQRGGRSSGAGLVFYNYGCHRIIQEIDISNRPAPLVASAEATGERGQNLYRYWFNSLQWAREIIFCVVRTPKADRGWSTATPQRGQQAAQRRWQ
ncbi:MAG TPA: hypothetical protein DEQ38_14040 [Elusimicrobia bacterium]|nr:hypothetical protein [Elusimicrobiota bacterium]